jgi:hypothetical protein
MINKVLMRDAYVMKIDEGRCNEMALDVWRQMIIPVLTPLEPVPQLHPPRNQPVSSRRPVIHRQA